MIFKPLHLLQVCKHYLVSFCPHELFVNTRADLGKTLLVLFREEFKEEFWPESNSSIFSVASYYMYLSY